MSSVTTHAYSVFNVNNTEFRVKHKNSQELEEGKAILQTLDLPYSIIL